MIKFLLQELEKSPNPLFTKNELLALSPEDFQNLIDRKILIHHRPTSSDFENVRLPRCQHGCPLTVVEVDGGYEAVCLDHPEEGSFPIDRDDLYRYAFSVEGLLKQIRNANQIIGKPQAIAGGLFYLGYKIFKGYQIGIIFITNPGRAKLVELSGFRHIFKRDNILIILTPASLSDDVILENYLSKDKMIRATLMDMLDSRTFELPVEKLIKPIFEQEEAASGLKTSVFRLMDGLQWKEVTIAIVSKDSIRISARGKSERFNYSEIGFKDNRKGDLPDSKWAILQVFAVFNGTINWERARKANIHGNLKANVSQLRRRLKKILGIEDDPFYPYRRHKAYVAKFTIRDESYGKTSPH